MSKDSHHVAIERNVPATLRDGTILRANITRPNADPVGALALQLRTGARSSRLEARFIRQKTSW